MHYADIHTHLLIGSKRYSKRPINGYTFAIENVYKNDQHPEYFIIAMLIKVLKQKQKVEGLN